MRSSLKGHEGNDQEDVLRTQVSHQFTAIALPKLPSIATSADQICRTCVQIPVNSPSSPSFLVLVSASLSLVGQLLGAERLGLLLVDEFHQHTLVLEHITL